MADDEWEVDVVVDLDTWDELLTALLRRGATHLLYRGQRDFDWQLACKLSRSLRAQAEAGGPIPLGLMESMVVDDGLNRHVERVETSLLRSFMEAAQGFGVPDLPPAADRLGWWEVMQHHRAPTRLMDWTRSPFVALWFALAFEDAAPPGLGLCSSDTAGVPSVLTPPALFAALSTHTDILPGRFCRPAAPVVVNSCLAGHVFVTSRRP